MFTTVAYTDSQATAQVDTDIPALSDPSMTILNGHFIFAGPVSVYWIYGMGLTMTRLRLTTPRLRPIARPVINPIDAAAAPSEAFRLFEYWRHPIRLNPVEETQFLRSKTSAVAEQDFVGLTVGDLNMNIPQGDLYVSRATTLFTPTINVWTSGGLTMDDTLQVGRYSILGLRVNNVGGVLARLVFPAPSQQGLMQQFRPGVKVSQSNSDEGIFWMRYGMLGEYGQFESFAIPQIEVLAATATANPEVFLDIVPVRVGAP